MSRRLPRLLLAYIVIMLLFLSACGTTSAPQVSISSHPGVLDASKQYTVDFWEALVTDADKTALAALVNQYTSAHKNVKINVHAYDSDATMSPKIFTAIDAKQSPAIALLSDNMVTLYQEDNNLMSLQPYVAGKNGLSSADLADFYAPLLKDGQVNGVQYALPFNKSNEVLYYNATLLKKNNIQPPTTLTDFVAASKKLTKADGSQWGLSLTPSTDEWATIYKDLGGKNFVTEDYQKTNFDQGPAQQALDLLASLVKSGVVHVTTANNWQNDFTSQKSAFALSTITSYPVLKEDVGNTFALNGAPFPGGPAGQFTELSGNNLAMFNSVSDDTRDAAWDFMKFLTNTSANTSFVQQTGFLPVRQSAFNSQSLQRYYAQDPVRKVGPLQIPHTYVATAAPSWDQCRNDITEGYVSVMTGHSSSAAALQTMAAHCQEDMSQ